MLKVENIDLAYGAARVLRSVSVEANVGEVSCVLGRNGVGKTSLLRAIVGHQPISAGAISLGGQDVSRLAPFERARRGVGYVPQGREIFPLLTVRENLETGFAPVPRRERYVPDEIFDLFPVLAEMMHRRGGDLSGGQQQQLAIARALAPSPKLLVLDEPTEGIQPNIIKDIGRVLKKLAKEGLNGTPMAIVLVEQYYDFAEELADRYLVMERGEVIASGPGDEMPEKGIRQLVAI
jgi:urea transport system ATP-binding protein